MTTIAATFLPQTSISRSGGLRMGDLQICSDNGSTKPDLHSSDLNALKPFTFSDDIDSPISTPYVSAPSSPGRGPPHSYGGGFFYSAPASPTHRLSASFDTVSSAHLEGAGGSFEFESGTAPTGSMSSADELFFNGQIRPMKLSSHLQRPQDLAPLIDVLENDGEYGGDGDGDGDEDDKFDRSRDLKSRGRFKPLRRRTRSMSPLRTNNAHQWLEEFKDGRESTEINEIKEKLEVEDKQRADDDTETPSSGASSRSSSVGRSSKRWVFLKELLYRSKSEGRKSTTTSRNHRFWSTLSFSPSFATKEKKPPDADTPTSKTAGAADETVTAEEPPPTTKTKTSTKKAANGVGMNRRKSRVRRSPHEVLYTTNRAQAEEMRKKTYLPYRQGVLGCLGFSSKSYGAINGFARALNPVSSR